MELILSKNLLKRSHINYGCYNNSDVISHQNLNHPSLQAVAIDNELVLTVKYKHPFFLVVTTEEEELVQDYLDYMFLFPMQVEEEPEVIPEPVMTNQWCRLWEGFRNWMES